LRKSVAKVVTLKHAVSVGGVPLNQLIAELIVAVGQAESKEIYSEEVYFIEEPDWFSTNKIELTINESDDKNQDKMVISYVMEGMRFVSHSGIVELRTNFIPEHGIELMHS